MPPLQTTHARCCCCLLPFQQHFSVMPSQVVYSAMVFCDKGFVQMRIDVLRCPLCRPRRSTSTLARGSSRWLPCMDFATGVSFNMIVDVQRCPLCRSPVVAAAAAAASRRSSDTSAQYPRRWPRRWLPCMDFATGVSFNMRVDVQRCPLCRSPVVAAGAASCRSTNTSAPGSPRWLPCIVFCDRGFIDVLICIL